MPAIIPSSRSNTEQFGNSPHFDFTAIPTASSVARAASQLTLSSASASAATDSVTLRFGGALDPDSAGDAAHYSVIVNGAAVTVESAAYNARNHSVTLGLPAGALLGSDQVWVQWVGLTDTSDAVVEGQTGPFTAR